MDTEKELTIEKRWKRKVKIDFKNYLKKICNGTGILKSRSIDFINLFILFDALLSTKVENEDFVNEFMKIDNIFTYITVTYRASMLQILCEDMNKRKK